MKKKESKNSSVRVHFLVAHKPLQLSTLLYILPIHVYAYTPCEGWGERWACAKER